MHPFQGQFRYLDERVHWEKDVLLWHPLQACTFLHSKGLLLLRVLVVRTIELGRAEIGDQGMSTLSTVASVEVSPPTTPPGDRVSKVVTRSHRDTGACRKRTRLLTIL